MLVNNQFIKSHSVCLWLCVTNFGQFIWPLLTSQPKGFLLWTISWLFLDMQICKIIHQTILTNEKKKQPGNKSSVWGKMRIWNKYLILQPYTFQSLYLWQTLRSNYIVLKGSFDNFIFLTLPQSIKYEFTFLKLHK